MIIDPDLCGLNWLQQTKRDEGATVKVIRQSNRKMDDIENAVTNGDTLILYDVEDYDSRVDSLLKRMFLVEGKSATKKNLEILLNEIFFF